MEAKDRSEAYLVRQAVGQYVQREQKHDRHRLAPSTATEELMSRIVSTQVDKSDYTIGIVIGFLVAIAGGALLGFVLASDGFGLLALLGLAIITGAEIYILVQVIALGVHMGITGARPKESYRPPRPESPQRDQTAVDRAATEARLKNGQ